MGQSRPPGVYRRSVRGPAAKLTLGAAAIHLSVAPDHLLVYVPFGMLFIAVGIAQAILGLAAWLRPSRSVSTAGMLIALGCQVVWTISRRAGLPVGPNTGRPETAGFPDLVTTLFEVTSTSTRSWSGRTRSGRVRSLPTTRDCGCSTAMSWSTRPWG